MKSSVEEKDYRYTNKSVKISGYEFMDENQWKVRYQKDLFYNYYLASNYSIPKDWELSFIREKKKYNK